MFASTVSSAGSRAIICEDKYSIPRDVTLLRRFFFVLAATLLFLKVCKWTQHNSAANSCQALPLNISGANHPPQTVRAQSHTDIEVVQGGCRRPGMHGAGTTLIPLLREGLRPSGYFNSWFLTILSCVCNRWIVICVWRWWEKLSETTGCMSQLGHAFLALHFFSPPSFLLSPLSLTLSFLPPASPHCYGYCHNLLLLHPKWWLRGASTWFRANFVFSQSQKILNFAGPNW